MPNLPNIPPELLKAYQEEIAKRSSPATAKRKTSSLRRFFDWAHREGHLDENPLAQPSDHIFALPPEKLKPSFFRLPNILRFAGLAGLLVLVFLLAKRVQLPIPWRPAPATEEEIAQQVPQPQPSPRPPELDTQAIIAEIREEVLKSIGDFSIDWASFEDGNLLIGGVNVSEMALSTADTSDGDITINPDGSGIAHFLFEGTSSNFLNAQAPNLIDGSLYYGIVANNATGYDLIKLQSGSKPITRFSVDALGETFIGGGLNVDGDIATDNTTRLTAEGELENITGYSQTEGNFTISQTAGASATITKKTSALSDLMVLTLDERPKPENPNSIYSTLVLNRYDGSREAMALFVDEGNARFDGQAQLGRFSSNPNSIGQGSLIFNTSDTTLYVWNGTSWDTIATGGTSPWTRAAGVIYPTTITDDLAIGGTDSTAPFFVDDSGNVTIDGNTALGDTASDTITFNAVAASTLNMNANTITNIGNAGTDFDTSGGLTLADDLAVNGGDITTSQTTFNLINTTATTLNIGGAATTLSLGASTGTTTVNNALTVTGTLTANGDVDLGNATGDTVTFTGRVDSNIVPSVTDTYDLGTSTLIWNELFVNQVCFDGAADCITNSDSGGPWTLSGSTLYPDQVSYRVGVGTVTAGDIISPLYVTSGATVGKAVAIFNQTESEDILTASASGTTRLTLTNAGSLVITDDAFLGLGAASGRLVFDSTPTPDVIDVQNANLDLNTNTITNIGNAGTDFSSTGGLTLADSLLLPNGSVGSPALAFSGDTDTGIFTSTPNWLSFVTLGQEQLTIKTTEIISQLTLNMDNDIITNIGVAGTDFTATGGLTLADDLAVNGGDITTTQTTFNLVNATATTVNFAGAATTLSIGASTGTTTVNNALTVTGTLTANGDVDLGNATGDTVTFTGRVDSNIVPSVTDTYDLGTSSLIWNELFVNQVCFDGAADCMTNSNSGGPWTLSGSVLYPDQASYRVGVGTTTAGDIISPLYVTSGATVGKAVAIFNQTEAEDILTASASAGTTRLTLTNAGNLGIEGNLYDITESALTINDSLSIIGANLTFTTTAGTIATSGNDALTVTSAGVGTLFLEGGSGGTIRIRTSSADRLFVDSGGNVGINTTGPDRKLDVLDNTNPQLRLTQADGTVYSEFQTDSSGNLTITTTGTAVTFSGDNVTVGADLAVNGGDITTTQTTFNLINATATTVNFAGAATTLNLADSTATKTIDIGGVTSSAADTINIATNATAGDIISIGNAAAGTTLALTGGDAWSMSTAGVLTLSADSAQTTAMVITDTDYTNALSVGDNNIIGTTANIDLTNFDVVGSTGNITTAGDMAVNGGNITSTGDLDINPSGGDLTVPTRATIGSGTAGVGKLTVTGAEIGKALSIFNETGNQDILNASASGVIKIALGRSGDIRLYDADSSNYTGLQAASTTTSSVTYKLPAADGSASQVLSTDASGNLSWIDVSGGAGSLWTDGSTYLYPTNRESARIYDSGGTDYIDIAHDGTDATLSFANTTALNINIGTIDLSAQTVDFTLNNAADALNFDSNTLSIDALNNRVGIGDATPLATFTVGSGDLFQVAGATGNITTAGVLDVNGVGTSDIAGTLNLSGDILASSLDLTIDPTGGGVKVGTGTPGTIDLAGDDLYVTQDLEVDGTIYDSSGNVVAGYWTRTSGTLYPSTLSDRVGVGTQTAGDIISKLYLTSNASALTGKSLAILNQTEDEEILVASKSGTTKFVVDTNGRVAIGWSGGVPTLTNPLEIFNEGVTQVASFTTAGNLQLDGDIAVDGGDLTSSASTFNLVDATPTTINFAGVATTLNIADSTTTKTIDIGGVTSSGTDTINIATEGTAADAISIGNSNVSTTLALTGGDDWSMAATGVLTMSASAAQTTAIVITDTDYTNSLSIGDNNIIGTTANIDLTNFDVIGSTGNITTSGDLAVNGGDITTTATTFNIDVANTGTIQFRDGTNTLAAIKDQGAFPFWNLAGKSTTGDPATCAEGDIYYNAADDTISICHTGNTWEQLDGGGAGGQWTHIDHALYPNDYWADDILIGGNSTASATLRIAASGNLDTSNNTIDWTLNNAVDALNFDSNTLSIDALNNRIGIGTTGPDSPLDVLSTGGTQLRLTYTDGSVFTTFDTDASGYLDIDPSGSRTSIDGSLQVGSVATAPVAYSRFGTTSTSHSFSTPDQVLTGALEVNGILYLDGSSTANDAGVIHNSNGTLFAKICSQGGSGPCASTSALENLLTQGSWNIDNNANVGKAALMVNQQKGGDIFTASASGSPAVTIENDGDITLHGGGNIQSTNNNNININAGSGTVQIGGGSGKLDVGTIDPVYTIGGERFATYMAGMIGIKEEVTGQVETGQYIPGVGYAKTIDFKEQLSGSDLWLFAKTTDLAKHIDRMVVLLSPSGNTRAWYEVDEANYTLTIYSTRPTYISYRLTAPRFDAEDWSNYSDSSSTGFILEDEPLIINEDGYLAEVDYLAEAEIIPDEAQNYSLKLKTGEIIETIDALAKLVVGNIRAGAVVAQEIATDSFYAFQGTVDNLLITGGLVTPVVETEVISPLADSDIIIDLENSPPEATESSFGKLIVKGEAGQEVASIDAAGNASFSGSLAADKVETKEIVASKIYADEIVAKDGRFGQVATESISGITLEEIEELLRQAEQDQTLMAAAQTWDVANATDSANLAELAVSNLYVTDQAAINILSVSSAIAVGPDLVIQSSMVDDLATNSIDTLTAPLSLQSLALAPIEMMAGMVRINTNGDVTIEGNLYVAGTIESSGLTLKGSEENGFGKLLSLENTAGLEVAAISASGAAEFAQVTTDKLVIAGADSSLPPVIASGEITTNATAGQAIIPAGASQITINNPNVTDYTLVYITPTSSTLNKVLYVKSKTAGQFVVGFSDPLSIDVEFNWWVINVRQ